MSWGDIFFGFKGRINRKVYWAGTALVGVAGFLFAGLLAYLATGDPLAPEVWEKPADQARLWVPVWLAYFGFLAWPSTALAVKRLHDRERPVWIWYVYYALALLVSLAPLRASLGEEPGAPFSVFGLSSDSVEIPLALLVLATSFLASYLFFELGVFRGVRASNAHGHDPLPIDYHGGDYDFWSWMFALEGRISRSKWWLGMFVAMSVLLVVALAIVAIVSGFLDRHPEITANLKNPAWFGSKEAEPIISSLGLWLIGPLIFACVIQWCLLALSVKRLHDRGLSSWLILVVVIPFFGAVAAPALAGEFDLSDSIVRICRLLLAASAIWSILQFGILKGERGSNEHGRDPLAG